MKVIAEKNEKLDVLLGSIASIVDEKYFYIPGWFEKTPEGNFQFHHMNNLPKHLIELVEEKNEKQSKTNKKT